MHSTKTNRMSSSIVREWFGPRFNELHPLLQELHSHGGALRGWVSVDFGIGIAGTIGKRLASKLDIPATAGKHQFEVNIRHTDDALHWDRRFGSSSRMCSTFHPFGSSADGYWIERTGPIQMKLAVDIIEGGWHWRCVDIRLRDIPFPDWLLPRTTAYKRIEDGKYRFHVAISLPVIGQVLCYNGLLAA